MNGPDARVLIIEDDIGQSAETINGLGNCGYRTQHVRTVEMALPLLSIEIFDLILLDNNLPGVMGMAAIPEIICRSPAPIILMSQWPENGIEKDSLLLGAKAFFKKPLDMCTLNKKIKQLLIT